MADARMLGAGNLSASYACPINADDTTLSANYRRNDASILEALYADLDIRSRIEAFGVGVAHPVVRTPRRDLTLSLAADRRENETSLLGIPYSFSPGTVDGRVVTSVLRLTAQYLERDTRQAFSARTSLHLGLDALEATVGPRDPDGHFVSLLAQAQYVRRLGDSRCDVVLKLAGQYADSPLLALEQFALGGTATVRGYRENTLVRDTGILASSEFRLPFWTGSRGETRAALVPFADFGAGWSHLDSPTPFDTLGSVGIGLVLTPHRNVTASLFWGHALRRVRYSTHDLQDDGLHFQCVAWAF